MQRTRPEFLDTAIVHDGEERTFEQWYWLAYDYAVPRRDELASAAAERLGARTTLEALYLMDQPTFSRDLARVSARQSNPRQGGPFFRLMLERIARDNTDELALTLEHMIEEWRTDPEYRRGVFVEIMSLYCVLLTGRVPVGLSSALRKLSEIAPARHEKLRNVYLGTTLLMIPADLRAEIWRDLEPHRSETMDAFLERIAPDCQHLIAHVLRWLGRAPDAT